IDQKCISGQGHAIEARIYSEDPTTFFPSPRHISKFELPQGNHIRNEVTVESDMEVTPFCDPMIGKLIVAGTTRDEAITRMKEALASYRVEGIKTNIPMLENIIGNDVFLSGRTTTAFIDEYYLPSLK